MPPCQFLGLKVSSHVPCSMNNCVFGEFPNIIYQNEFVDIYCLKFFLLYYTKMLIIDS